MPNPWRKVAYFFTKIRDECCLIVAYFSKPKIVVFSCLFFKTKIHGLYMHFFKKKSSSLVLLQCLEIIQNIKLWYFNISFYLNHHDVIWLLIFLVLIIVKSSLFSPQDHDDLVAYYFRLIVVNSCLFFTSKSWWHSCLIVAYFWTKIRHGLLKF